VPQRDDKRRSGLVVICIETTDLSIHIKRKRHKKNMSSNENHNAAIPPPKVKNFESSGKKNDDNLQVRIVSGRVPSGAVMKAFPQVVDGLTCFDSGATPAILVDDLDVLSERQVNKHEIAPKTSEISRIEAEWKSEIARIEAEGKEQFSLILKSIADMQAKHDADIHALQKKIADLKTQVDSQDEKIGKMNKKLEEVNEKLEELEELKEENGKLVSRVALLENLPRTLNV